MPRRQAALIPLTHDHHHALSQARKLRIAADSNNEQEWLSAAREFVDFYDRETVVHFREEEEVVFPLMMGAFPSPPELLVQILVEHLQIHYLAGSLKREIDADEVSSETVLKLAHLLESHIRTEERELFPLIERSVPATELGQVHLSTRNRD
jgi:hemerythrin-like domain-containing protein